VTQDADGTVVIEELSEDVSTLIARICAQLEEK